jgi:5-methylcytosine-specific restriction endonuclease McrA
VRGEEMKLNYEEAVNFVAERDEGICQNCGDIVVNNYIVQIDGKWSKTYNPDNYWLVCGRCFQKFSKRNYC